MTNSLLSNFSGPLYRQEGNVGAYQVLLPYLTMRSVMRRYMPVEYGESFGWMKQNQIQAAFREEDFRRVASGVLEAAKDGFPEAWDARWKELDRELTENARRFVLMDLGALSTEDLVAEYERMNAIDEDMWALSICIDAFDTGFDQQEIDRISTLHGLTPEEAHLLTTPLVPSYMTKVEHMVFDAMKTGDFSGVKRDFFWYGTNYSTFVEADEAFFTSVAASAHASAFVSPETEEREILACHGLDKNPLEFFRKLTLWRDERKRVNYTGLYALSKLLRECARRHGMDPALINGLIPYQIPDFIEGKISAVDLQKQLEEGFMFHITLDGRFEYLFGAEAETLWQEIEALYVSGHESVELKGTVASRGHATGKVRVIQNPTGASIDQGDILVTSMTRPEFLHLMKRAGAIVTDEGGITSHAAIVSRELRIPCVIGAKIASKILKDGDMVEVDATTGVVRKI